MITRKASLQGFSVGAGNDRTLIDLLTQNCDNQLPFCQQVN